MGKQYYDLYGWSICFNLFDDYNTPSLIDQPERWEESRELDVGTIKSLALLGASIVLLSVNIREKQKSTELNTFYIPNNIPSWIVNEIGKYFKDNWNCVDGDKTIDYENVINNKDDDTPIKKRRKRK